MYLAVILNFLMHATIIEKDLEIWHRQTLETWKSNKRLTFKFFILTFKQFYTVQVKSGDFLGNLTLRLLDSSI